MKLTVLTDNNTYIDQYYYGEPAVCFYIEDGNQKILFDSGYSDVFIKNAELLNIDLTKVSKVVLSHGHNDHTRGLRFFCEQFDTAGMGLIAHPEALTEKWFGKEYIGSELKKEELEKHFQVTLSRAPRKISDRLWFLGEIPTAFAYEQRKAIGCQGSIENHQPDLIMDDTALAYKGKDGLVIITACSHSGICSIIEYAKKICEETKIQAVIGGFHLFKKEEQLEKTIQYFTENAIRDIFPCHCVSFEAKAEIHQRIPIHEVGVGLQLEW